MSSEKDPFLQTSKQRKRSNSMHSQQTIITLSIILVLLAACTILFFILWIYETIESSPLSTGASLCGINHSCSEIHEECVAFDNSPTGQCVCLPGFSRSANLSCVPSCTFDVHGSSTTNGHMCKVCSQGRFMDRNNSCIRCPMGRVNNDTGTTSFGSCRICPFGTITDALHTRCVPCSPGKIAMTEENKCVECDPGYFSNTHSGSVCQGCASGRFAISAGQTVCDDCSPGLFSNESKSRNCLPCSRGFYNNVPAGQTCLSCMPGWFNEHSASSSCVMCTPGFMSVTLSATSCNECPRGSFSTNEGSTSCTMCSKDKFASLAGMTTCLSCAPNTSTLGHTGSTFCVPQQNYNYTTVPCTNHSLRFCPPGHKVSNVLWEKGTFDCVECSKGMFLLSSEQCAVCPDGRYQPSSAQNNCLPCQSGIVTNNSSDCVLCTAGFFVNSAQTTCLPCEPGKAQHLTDETSCLSCPAGLYNTDFNASKCLDCSPGLFSNFTETVMCYPCAPGEFQQNAGQKRCEPCPRGSFSSVPQSRSCELCLPGRYQPNTSSTYCIDCTAGFFQPQSGQSACLVCSPGFFRAYTTAAYVCNSCSPGYYQDAFGQSSCKLCHNGTASLEVARSYPCPNCVLGKYSSKPGALQCTDCPAGFVSNNTTQSCRSCDIGFFNSYITQGRCVRCANGYFTNITAATRCQLCKSNVSAILSDENITYTSSLTLDSSVCQTNGHVCSSAFIVDTINNCTFTKTLAVCENNVSQVVPYNDDDGEHGVCLVCKKPFSTPWVHVPTGNTYCRCQKGYAPTVWLSDYSWYNPTLVFESSFEANQTYKHQLMSVVVHNSKQLYIVCEEESFSLCLTSVIIAETNASITVMFDLFNPFDSNQTTIFRDTHLIPGRLVNTTFATLNTYRTLYNTSSLFPSTVALTGTDSENTFVYLSGVWRHEWGDQVIDESRLDVFNAQTSDKYVFRPIPNGFPFYTQCHDINECKECLVKSTAETQVWSSNNTNGTNSTYLLQEPQPAFCDMRKSQREYFCSNWFSTELEDCLRIWNQTSVCMEQCQNTCFNTPGGKAVFCDSGRTFPALEIGNFKSLYEVLFSFQYLCMDYNRMDQQILQLIPGDVFPAIQYLCFYKEAETNISQTIQYDYETNNTMTIIPLLLQGVVLDNPSSLGLELIQGQLFLVWSQSSFAATNHTLDTETSAGNCLEYDTKIETQLRIRFNNSESVQSMWRGTTYVSTTSNRLQTLTKLQLDKNDSAWSTLPVFNDTAQTSRHMSLTFVSDIPKNTNDCIDLNECLDPDICYKEEFGTGEDIFMRQCVNLDSTFDCRCRTGFHSFPVLNQTDSETTALPSALLEELSYCLFFPSELLQESQNRHLSYSDFVIHSICSWNNGSTIRFTLNQRSYVLNTDTRLFSFFNYSKLVEYPSSNIINAPEVINIIWHEYHALTPETIHFPFTSHIPFFTNESVVVQLPSQMLFFVMLHGPNSNIVTHQEPNCSAIHIFSKHDWTSDMVQFKFRNNSASHTTVLASNSFWQQQFQNEDKLQNNLPMFRAMDQKSTTSHTISERCMDLPRCVEETIISFQADGSTICPIDASCIEQIGSDSFCSCDREFDFISNLFAGLQNTTQIFNNQSDKYIWVGRSLLDEHHFFKLEVQSDTVFPLTAEINQSHISKRCTLSSTKHTTQDFTTIVASKVEDTTIYEGSCTLQLLELLATGNTLSYELSSGVLDSKWPQCGASNAKVVQPADWPTIECTDYFWSSSDEGVAVVGYDDDNLQNSDVQINIRRRAMASHAYPPNTQTFFTQSFMSLSESLSVDGFLGQTTKFVSEIPVCLYIDNMNYVPVVLLAARSDLDFSCLPRLCRSETPIRPCALVAEECHPHNGCLCTKEGFHSPIQPTPLSCSNGVPHVGNCCATNECISDTHNCPTESTCQDTYGSFSCECNVGFIDEDCHQQTCQDNPCADFTPNATCTNTGFEARQWSCDCPVGFSDPTQSKFNNYPYYDSTECLDIDECNFDPCQIFETCVNTQGSYNCV